MTYKYFNPRPVTLDEGKAMYRALADANHPDHGGSVEVMQAINAEWDDLKGRLPKFVPPGYKPREEKATRQDVRPEVAEMLRNLAGLQGLKFDLVGEWIWCDPSARHAETLNSLGFTWSTNRRRYYWHPADSKAGRARKCSYSHIYAKYDGQSYTGKGLDELKTA